MFLWQVYLGGVIILTIAVAATYVIAYNLGWKDRERAYMRLQASRQERFRD